jgi:hypothetical protein
MEPAGIISLMNWNDAAEDLLLQVLGRTPRPTRDQAERDIRQTAEQIAGEQGSSRVGVNTVVEAWVRSTPEPLRDLIPQTMSDIGLDPHDYDYLFPEQNR